jgi:predicted type IV restriction endonuclease
VYPLKPDLAEYTTEVVPGWWLGTNIANREKMKIIRKACEAADVRFGTDVQIELPNAN